VTRGRWWSGSSWKYKPSKTRPKRATDRKLLFWRCFCRLRREDYKRKHRTPTKKTNYFVYYAKICFTRFYG